MLALAGPPFYLAHMASILDTYFITIDLHARYTVEVPAETTEEAMMTAYNRSIPVSRLSDVETNVVKVVRMKERKGEIDLTVEKNS